MSGNTTNKLILVWKRLIAGLFLGLLLTGCADLSAIRKFASVSTEAENYKGITEDFVKIPEREKYYVSSKEYASVEAIEKQREKELKPGLLALHTGVVEYMKSLGELAGDELISYDKSLDPLIKEVEDSALVKGGWVTKQTADCFGDLAKLLAKAVTDAYRRNKLREVIGLANQPLGTIIANQKDIIKKGYIVDLINEKDFANEYYSKIITGLGVLPPEKRKIIGGVRVKTEDKIKCLGEVILASEAVPKNEALAGALEKPKSAAEMAADTLKKTAIMEKKATLVLLRDEMQTKLTDIDKKIKAAEKYLVVLDTIQKGHQQLYDMRDQIKSPVLLSLINTYSAEIQKLYPALIALK
jgi:hypothetical protein